MKTKPASRLHQVGLLQQSLILRLIFPFIVDRFDYEHRVCLAHEPSAWPSPHPHPAFGHLLPHREKEVDDRFRVFRGLDSAWPALRAKAKTT